MLAECRDFAAPDIASNKHGRNVKHVSQSQATITQLAVLLLLLPASCLGAKVPGIHTQTATAAACQGRFANEARGGAAVQDTLAAVYLHAHILPSIRDSLLACSINNLLKNIGQHTPLHVYVFVLEPFFQHLSQILQDRLGDQYKRVCVIKIEREQWNYNPRKHNYKMKVNKHKFGNYLTMGQWRMLVPFHLMASLNYPFVLQVDDDLQILEPLKMNLVETMRRNNQTIATHRMPVEYYNIMYGLPELAKFYLASNNVKPGGTLFQHLKPPNMDGLFSIGYNWWKKPDEPHDGYDLMILYGNFFVISTSLWQKPEVQDWITLCMTSGGLERHRWQEQGVMSFVWLLFTEPHELLFLDRSQLQWLHTRRISRLKRTCGPLA